MSVIYEPKGAAREYSELACNLYIGCEHGCKYCYVPGIPPYKYKPNPRDTFHSKSEPRKDILKLVEKDASKLKGTEKEILLCFTCDPYQVGRDNSVTTQALEIFRFYGLNIQILTKGGKAAIMDFPLMQSMGAKFATTLCFTDDVTRQEWEPKAASVADRIESIKYAHFMGIDTWVSIEPVIDPAQALQLIESLSNEVDFWKVGKLNHVTNDTDWGQFYRDVTKLLEGKPHMIKDALLAYK